MKTTLWYSAFFSFSFRFIIRGFSRVSTEGWDPIYGLELRLDLDFIELN